MNQVLVSEKLLFIKETFAKLLSALDKRHICEQTVLFTPSEISILSCIFLFLYSQDCELYKQKKAQLKSQMLQLQTLNSI